MSGEEWNVMSVDRCIQKLKDIARYAEDDVRNLKDGESLRYDVEIVRIGNELRVREVWE